ncbi:MAG: Regulatory protein AtoC [Phycisphaerae bacterium]|nr:Regulatory protein AtoC [Phycisphaerae bacterium]
MARVYVVDDNELLQDSLREALIREEHQVETFSDPVEALVALKKQRCDVLISDLKMPRMDGITFMKEALVLDRDLTVILMTAFASVSTAVQAMKVGAFDYLQKPFEADEITVLVERAYQHRCLRADNEALRTSLHDRQQDRQMVGQSRLWREVRQRCEQVAASSATVLVMGESGTGKELVAREVHRLSPRADRPLLAVNCAALSSNLLESELFGHERGAFTGADRPRKGRFELADGGTLLLDEISEMALPLQSKLLRVLQERQFERVGSSATQTVDVRVIATTNRDLREWVRAGKFREDLYYRLHVLPMQLPPLRERREDIPLLVDYFLESIARRDGRPKVTVESAALRMLRDYHWPGNVRELENVCERSVVMAGDRILRSSVLEPWLSGESSTTMQEGTPNLRPGRMLDDMERQLIERMLIQFNGHREKTARALGIGVRTLGMKLKKWHEEARKAG